MSERFPSPERGAEQAFEAGRLEKLFKYTEARATASGRIQESDFVDSESDIYNAESVAADRAYVEKRKRDVADALARLPEDERRSSEEGRKLARVMEVMLFEEGESSNWFGADAHTALASEYDDWRNGVDAVVEFEYGDGAKHLALAVDFTLLKSDSWNKIEGIKEDIGRGQAARVKYFQSEYEKEKRPLGELAKVIVACDAETLFSAAALLQKKESSREARQALARHPIQMVVLREIQAQLDAYRLYAEQKKRHRLADMYADNLAMVDAIVGEKTPYIAADVKNDGGFRALERGLKIVFSWENAVSSADQ